MHKIEGVEMKILINWLRMASSVTFLMLLTVSSAWASGSGVPLNGNGIISVPEPATLGLLALGIAGIVLARRKKK